MGAVRLTFLSIDNSAEGKAYVRQLSYDTKHLQTKRTL